MTKDSKHTTQLLVLKLFLKSLSSEILETGIREFRRPPSEVFFSFFFFYERATKSSFDFSWYEI